ncbi:MAG: ATPase domain-containing protein [Candidatus Odinarchaeia archaeon]
MNELNSDDGFIPTGLKPLDDMLAGGLTPGKIYHIFGPSGSGKTAFALQLVKFELINGNNICWVDTEGKDFINRLVGILQKPALKKWLKNILVFKIMDFKQQSYFVDRLFEYINRKTRLVVFDTITNLYRASLLDKSFNVRFNKELNRQLAVIKSVCVKKRVVVVLLNQVSSIFNSENGDVRGVAASIVDYWSDVCFQLNNLTGNEKELNMFLCQEKKRKIRIKFKITNTGLNTVVD